MVRKWAVVAMVAMMSILPLVAEGEAFSVGVKVEGEGWRVAMQQLNDKLRRDTAAIEKIDAQIERDRGLLEAGIVHYEDEVKTCYYSMLQQDRYDALRVTLYGEKITALCKQLRQMHAEFVYSKGRIREYVVRYERLTSPEFTFAEEAVAADLRELMAKNHLMMAKLNEILARWEVLVDEIEARFVETEAVFDAIEQSARERQDEVIKTIFFNNQLSLLQVLPDLKIDMQYWMDDLSAVTALQVKQFVGYWEICLVIAVGVFVGLVLLAWLINRFWFFRFLQMR